MASTEASETKSIIISLLTSSPLRCTLVQLCNDFRTTVGYNIPYAKLGFSNAEQYLRSIPDTVQVCGSGQSAEVRGVVTERSAHINLMVAKQRKTAIPAHKRKYIKPFKSNIQHSNYSRNRNEFNANTSSNFVQHPQSSLHEDEYKSRVPKTVQNNLRKLIMHHPNGIWCRNLRDAYCKMFNEDINYERYKFRSLIELCTDLTEIFHYIQPSSEDFMLYDKTRAVPQMNQNEVARVDEDVGNLEIDWSLGSALIPDDIVPFLDQIPQLCLSDIKVGDYLDIKIAEIYDIYKFYVYPKYGDLEHLLDDIRTVFCSNKRNVHSIPYVFCVQGLYCIAYYNKAYHRSVIIDAAPGSIKVLFIDYGSVGEVSNEEVWYLPKEFGVMPCQAMQARLSRIRSSGNCQETTEKFKQLITRREVVVEVMRVDEKEQTLEVYLADVTNSEDIFFVNDALVEKGYAEYLDKDKAN